MNDAIVGAGSNIDAAANMQRAKERLSTQLQLVASSALVQTEPIGITDQPPFLNACFAVRTALDRPALVALLKSIEDDLKRDRTAPKFGPRTIDLDVVVWNGKIVDSDAQDRAFLRDAIRELCPEAFDHES